MTFSAPAQAQQAVNILSPFPVLFTNTKNCVFVGTCAVINTIGIGAFIDFNNSGSFATTGAGAFGMWVDTISLFVFYALPPSGYLSAISRA